MDINRERMLKEVMAADFTLIELNLYLNTHPTDQNALQLFTNYARKASMLRENFEKMYGPLTPMSPYVKYPWPWIESPWPWEKQ